MSDDVTVDDEEIGSDSRSNLRFWLIDQEWMTNPENMTSLQNHVLDHPADGVTNVMILFGQVHDDLQAPADRFGGDSRSTLHACEQMVAQSSDHVMQIFRRPVY